MKTTSQHYELELSIAERTALKDLLVETSLLIDDDGREGAFEASPLFAIYRKLIAQEAGK